MCKVTVVTTCFNAGEYLKKTILSVLGQKYTDFEYIIQDGGSKDDTVKIAKSFIKAFEERNIPFYIFSNKDNGIYDGMNKAVASAKGEFVNFMNADDVFFDENVLSDIFEKDDCNSADIIYGDCVEIEFGDCFYFPKDAGKIQRAMPFSHQSVFARTSLLREFPFKEELRIGGDYDFLLSAFDAKAKFIDCGRVVCIITKDGVSSTDLYNTFVETIEIQKAHGIERFSEKKLKKKLFYLRIKQFGMDYLPKCVKKLIRLFQRKMRGQSLKADMSVKHF